MIERNVKDALSLAKISISTYCLYISEVAKRGLLYMH